MSFAFANKTKVIILAQAILFSLLITLGISGSSISNIRSHVPGVLSMDERILIGRPQGARSDEWAVNTLLSIGQYKNKNPRINPNLGPTPKDMSIVHDTGVPTNELSTFSKVNLWGFFVFDLRRALAWDWWIPVIVGLNGIWLLLNLLFPGQSIFNFSLALLLTLAPESVVWSNWPILHVGTASLAVSLAIIALKSRSILKSLTLAFLTGLLTAWFVLQLYLPRLIPVALISVAAYAGYCISNHVKFFTKNNCVFIIYALLIASCLILDWYSRNYDGIAGMLNSSYPGHRRIYGGTELTDWPYNYARGWLFPITINKRIYANSCEAQSYIGLFIPVTILVSYYIFKYYHKLNYTVLFTFGLLLLFIVYEYAGIPEVVGKLTFLDRSKPYRSIIGISFTTIILLAFLYQCRCLISIKHKFIIYALSLLPFVIFFCLNKELENSFAKNYLSKFIYILFFIIIINLVLIYKIKYITISLLLFVTPVTLFWNPIIIAPSHLQVNVPEQIQIKNHGHVKYDGRLLIVGDYPMIANVFFASGYKVMNATSHYVDPYMFDNFYSKLKNSEQYNRFNHLEVLADDSPDINISLGGTDWIKMRLSAKNYDFAKFPVDYLAVQQSPFIEDLNSNSRLEFIEKIGKFYFYKVKN